MSIQQWEFSILQLDCPLWDYDYTSAFLCLVGKREEYFASKSYTMNVAVVARKEEKVTELCHFRMLFSHIDWQSGKEPVLGWTKHMEPIINIYWWPWGKKSYIVFVCFAFTLWVSLCMYWNDMVEHNKWIPHICWIHFLCWF